MLLLSAGIHACAFFDYSSQPGRPSYPIPQPSDRQGPSVQVQTYEIDQEQTFEAQSRLDQSEDIDPWRLVELAQNQSPVDNALLLRAAELFLKKHFLATGLSIITDIDTAGLRGEQNIFRKLMLAKHALLSGETTKAKQILSSIQGADIMAKANYARWLELDIAISDQQKDYLQAIVSRIKRDALLDQDAQLQNQLQILNTLTRHHAFFSRLNLDVQSNEITPWWALVQLQRQHPISERDLATWQLRYKGHSAQIQNLHKTLSSPPVSTQQIALLLPLNSKLGRAASTFQAGFEAAMKKSSRYATSRVYDIGNETGSVPFYYQSAVNNNADIVIGPMGRTNVKALMQYLENTTQSTVATMLLGDISKNKLASPNIWGFSLSAEQDAEAIAERAISLGFQNALVLQKNNDWGKRIGFAFSKAFSARGGKILDSQVYKPGNNDHSTSVKNLLNINDSEVRHLRLQKLLGRKLKASVRRRDDVDFIFLAGNAKEARNIVPLVKYYRAHDIPLFATAGVFSGKFNKLMDQDLAGMQFPDLPWMLEQGQSTAQSPRVPYTNATLNRLYALGFAAFEALSGFSKFPLDSLAEFDAKTMSLWADNNRNLQHKVSWGKYHNNGISLLP